VAWRSRTRGSAAPHRSRRVSFASSASRAPPPTSAPHPRAARGGCARCSPDLAASPPCSHSIWYPARDNANRSEVRAIQALEFARDLAQLAHNKQGYDVVILDVVEALGIADYFVIVSARNVRHAQAIAAELEYEMKHRGRPRLHAAGVGGENRWVLLDFGDVVVHVLVEEARAFYALEDLWADAPRTEFQPLPQTDAAASGTQ
jgi:ribosome-associated protein